MNELGNFIGSGSKNPIYLRKKLTIDKAIKRAVARVCGLGQFVFSINGKKIGDHELDPGWTDYRKVIEYVTFDVSRDLRTGENVIGAEVGNGWFLLNTEHYSFHFPDFMPPNPNPYRPFANELMFAMKLSIEYSDGSSEDIFADNEFKVLDHYITQSNVYGSETMDGRRFEADWCLSSYDDSGWKNASYIKKSDVPGGRMIEQFQNPVKVINSYNALKIGSVNGRDIYDIGQNCSGILDISISGNAGDIFKIFPAEKLNENGDVDQFMKGWAKVDTVVTLIIGPDGRNNFRQKFTYLAGRYFAVEKSNPSSLIKAFRIDAVSSVWERSGFFKSDNERFNAIYDLVEKSVEANMISVHTDCPTIERFAWQEPNHLMAPSIMYMKKADSLWKKFFMDMRSSQHNSDDIFFDYDGNKIPAGDGLIPSQCPCYIPNVLPVPGMRSFYDIIPWGSALILGVRWHYLFYGDKSVITDNYDACKKYLSYLKTRINEDGFINHGLGDWGNPDGEFARENIETAFLYADLKTAAYFAEILGLASDRSLYEASARQIKENYNSRLLTKDKEGKFFYKSFEHKDKNVMTLACEALPLYFGLVPSEAEQDVVSAFRRLLLEKGSLASGEIGLPYIIQTARKYEMNDILAEYIVRDEHPSYYAFVKDGLTTLGEYWEKNPRSHCHDMMGHIIEWYYNGIAGIIPLKEGFKKVLVEPFLPKSMNEFECSYKSVSGIIRVSVKRINGKIFLNAEADNNIELLISRRFLDK
ncbi:family 78 glycoside hydrolase catalytic domain [Lachnospiraceae bacterium C1.1]|nr:family 78 glycoside hydrolase catalytic domain [Lachnospiraceae bacterium C1.1]